MRAAGTDERQRAAPEDLGGDRVVLGGQRRVGEPVAGAGVVEHLDGAAAREDVADRLPLVMLRLAEVDVKRLGELVTDAWRMRAPDGLV